VRLQSKNLNVNRFIVLFPLVVILTTGCATPPEPAKEPEPQTTAPEPAPAAPAEEPAVTRKVEAKPVLTGAAAKTEAQKHLRSAFELLNDGNEEEAMTELKYVQTLEPDNKTAQCLIRGMTADPAGALGKEYTSYVVRPGESLGRIAQRALGDVCEFYILARYNQIKIPKRLAAGQTIRVPGKVALAPPESAPAAATQPSPVTPASIAPVPEAAPPTSPSTAKEAQPDEAAKKALIQRHQRNAQAAFRRQDLATSIKEWDRVLELDPRNELAKVRREEALDLARRLKQIK
jgi:LysM repeat protein